jgi:hypothetical protein
MSRRVAIVGSRYRLPIPGGDPGDDFYEEQLWVASRNREVIRKIEILIMDLPKDTVVISGGAGGVDTWAAKLARRHGLAVVVHRAEWNTYGKRAGMLRNATIVEDATEVWAFWDGKSKGTANTIERARIAGKLKGVEVT